MFSLFNFSLAFGAPADGSLLHLRVLFFVNQLAGRALKTEEISAGLTVVADVFKIESRSIAALTSTFLSLESFGDEESSFLGGGQVKGSVSSGVLETDVTTLGEETFQNFNALLIRSGLVD